MKIQGLYRRTAFCFLGLTSFSASYATELDIHGSFAQGYVVSDGNNSYGASNHGSRDLYEVALNARTSLTPEILVSGQVMARRAGVENEGKLRVDFAQVDYQFYTALSGDAGIRAGRLKNPYGLYNDSRDVVFSRPGITMPASVYFEGVGLRNLFFSSDGVQAYGHISHGQYSSEIVLGWTRDTDVTDEFQSLTPRGIDGKVKLDDFRVAQWMNEWRGGQFRAGLSYLGATLAFEPNDPQAILAGLGLDAELYVLSFLYQAERYSITAEYMQVETVYSGPAIGSSRSASDGGYVQLRNVIDDDWASYLRYDLSFSNRHDRDGRDSEAATGRPRHTQFTRDHVAGLQWTPTANWGIFLEYHYTDGTSSTSASSNAGRTLERYSQTLLGMLAYQF